MAYYITVNRTGRDSGTLSYSGGVSIATTCWWDPQAKIPAGTYSGCSATFMSNKKNSSGGKREGIYIPNVAGHSGIFVHMGTSAAWSDGCIVIEESEMLRLWNDISPKDGHNVTIQVMG